MKELIKDKFYDATKLLPVVNPTEEYDRRQGIYKWGSDNLYPNYLASLYYNCAIHNGIIRQKVHYTVSAGLKYEGSETVKFDLFLKNGNSDYDLNEVCEMLSQDLEIYNSYAFTVNYVDKKPYQIDYIPFETLRRIYEPEDEYEWESCENWSDKNTETRKYKLLDINNRVGQQIVVYREEPKQIKIGSKLTKGIYPAPPYSGGILAIETDIEINNYRRNEINNNFALGTIINFNNGQPVETDDRDEIVRNVQRTGQGSSNAGGVMAVFNNGKDKETTVVSLTGNNLDARYLALSKDNKDNILLAHSVTNPLLFGIKTEGMTFGGGEELKISYELMKKGYFKYRQRAITSPLQYIFKTLLLGQGKITFNEVSLDLPEPKVSTNTFNFNKETDIVINAFKMVGKPKEQRRILKSRKLDLNNFSEEEFLNSYKSFADVTDLQVNVLSLINEGNDFDAIRKTLNINGSNLSKIYDNLSKEGYLSGDKVTDAGIRLLASSNKVKLTVSYSYEVRPELNQPEVIKTTRDFCRELISLNKVYTRGEIEQIGALVDRDVWLYRGGWYHNPNTDRNTPFCRHYWQQNIILE